MPGLRELHVAEFDVPGTGTAAELGRGDGDGQGAVEGDGGQMGPRRRRSAWKVRVPILEWWWHWGLLVVRMRG